MFEKNILNRQLMHKLKTGLRFIKARVTGKRIPLFVGWDLTSRCNFDCAYCGVPQQADTVQELNTADVLDGIAQLAKMGTTRIHFGGGEVLLRNDLGIILKACKDKNIYTAVLTNGMLVAERLADLKHADMLNISFDGHQEVHDKLRQQGSYSEVIKALDLCAKEKIKITLNTTLSNLNIEHIGFILDFAKKHNTVIRFQLLNNLLSGNKDISGLILSKQQQNTLLNRIIRFKHKYRNILNSFSALKYLRDYPDVKFPGCCAGKIYMRISEDGRIFPCSIMKQQVVSSPYPQSDIKNMLEKLPLVQCANCLCTPTLEACFIYNLNLEVLLNAFQC